VHELTIDNRNRYGARQLNEQNIFLSLFGLVLGTAYGVKRVMKDRNVIKFPAVQVINCYTARANVTHIVTHMQHVIASKATCC
jgi:hypothetical protein